MSAEPKPDLQLEIAHLLLVDVVGYSRLLVNEQIELLHQLNKVVRAWVGKKDLACEQLDLATKLPGYLSYGALRLHPYWGPLRGDPRFAKIVSSLAPK